MKSIIITLRRATFILIAILFLGTIFSLSAFAENTAGIIMTPMYERLILDPGETYKSSFKITAPGDTDSEYSYKIYIQEYFRDDDNSVIFRDVNGHSQITKWITIDSPETGTISSDDVIDINFTINVPSDAPAGGQYAVITVSTDSRSNPEETEHGVSIQESVAIGYTIYVEVTGTTIHQGEIISAEIPSFLLSGNISASSTVKNTGNSHGDAKYTLQVFPLFSNEEVYTNEESPKSIMILPDRTVHSELAWENTPAMGIFNVIYTVEFEGVTTQVKKLVIKCSVWLLFAIIFGIIVLITWIVLRTRSRRHAKRHIAPTPTKSSEE